MLNSFKKKLEYYEVKWGLINIPVMHRQLFPINEHVTFDYNGKLFSVSMNKAGRIASKKLFKELKPQIGSILTITKKSDSEFTLSR